MFNGRWEQRLDRDDQGRIFLDFDPYCFQQILFYLRSRNLLSSAEAIAALPEVDPCKKHAYMDLVKFLLLEEFMGYSGGAAFRCVKFEQAGSGVQFMDNGQQAKGITAGISCRNLVTSSSLGSVCFLKCKIHQASSWMFVGVGADLALDGQYNYAASTTYGWGKNDGQYVKGQKLSCPAFQWGNGEWVLVKADFPAGKLSMVSTQASTPLTMSLEVPANLQDQYVFQVILYNCNDQVELLPVTAQDEQLLP